MMIFFALLLAACGFNHGDITLQVAVANHGDAEAYWGPVTFDIDMPGEESHPRREIIAYPNQTKKVSIPPGSTIYCGADGMRERVVQKIPVEPGDTVTCIVQTGAPGPWGDYSSTHIGDEWVKAKERITATGGTF